MTRPRIELGTEHKCNAFVAQLVERKTLNLVVVGSIPIEGVTF